MAAVTFDLETLGGDLGFTLRNFGTVADFGQAVSSAGDFNGDGISDLLIAAPSSVNGPGVFIVFGRAGATRGSTHVEAMAPAEVVVLRAASDVFSFGTSVASAGDVNGDGIDDIIVGSPQFNGSLGMTGAAWVIYGSPDSSRPDLDVANLTAQQGFLIEGPTEFASAGFSVSGAGDVNGDGLADLMIGAFGGAKGAVQTGEAYVVFGKAGTSRGTVQLSSLADADGFVIEGAAADDNAGRSVRIAGDINKDGIDDLIVGAPGSDTGGSESGAAYVIFGKSGGSRADIDLANLSSSNGFLIRGDAVQDYAGAAVSGAGDVNGDGIDDLIVGAPGAGVAPFPGGAYVIFGKEGATRATIDLGALAASDGYFINGEGGEDYTGYSVSAAGDVNGDNIGDLIIGAHLNESGGSNAGAAFVVFGKAGTRATVNLATLSASDGFKLQGLTDTNFAGRSASAAGDINNDGFDDIIIGAPLAPSGISSPGEAYVIFGRSSFSFGANSAPSANNDVATGDEETFIFIDVLGNDSDPNGNPLSVISTTNGANGAAIVVSDNRVLYRPVADFSGTDTFTYTISDGRGGTDTATVTVTVRAVNDAPTAPATNSVFTNEDETSEFVQIGASDPEGDPLSYSIKSGFGPSLGSVSFDGGSFRYTPDANENGSDSFVILISDNNGGVTEQSVAVSIQPVNDDPVAVDDSFIVGQDTNLTITVEQLLANDIDIDGDQLNILRIFNAVNGSAVFNSDFVDFAPEPGFTGTAGFDYEIYDNAGGVSIGHVTITVAITDGALGVDLGDFKPEDGFVVSGTLFFESLGFNVSAAGDVNHDGIADIVIGGPRSDAGGDLAGRTYVIYGKTGTLRANIDTSVLSASDGFHITGDTIGDFAGYSVAGLGDINGDGIDDFAVGAHLADDGGGASGQTYVIFGKAGATRANIDLTNLSAADGFMLTGKGGSLSGTSVSGLGDINGDGLADFIIGAPNAEGGEYQSGQAYIIFGKTGSTRPAIDLAQLQTADGVTIAGAFFNGAAGFDVSGGGDVNGDGIADIIIGARGEYDQLFSSGAAYVVYGKQSGAWSDIDLGNLTAQQGYRLRGTEEFGRAGNGVSVLGDVNADGIDDLIIGAPGAFEEAGQAYIIFGQSGTNRTEISLNNLGSAGFTITGRNAGDALGYSVASAGDFNGDGIEDIALGVSRGDGGGEDTGEAFVIFGKAGAARGDIDLANLTLADGFSIRGDKRLDLAGFSVSSAGDINNDGFDDLIVGAPDADAAEINAGKAYIIYGRASITVVGNNPPEAPAQNSVTVEKGQMSQPVAIGASDANGDTLTYRVKSGSEPSLGSVSFANGAFTYTPNGNAVGSDNFTIVVDDGRGGIATQLVSVTIVGTNALPVAGADALTGMEDTVVTVSASQLLANDSDADGDPLSIVAVGNAQNGSVSLNGTTISFAPAANFNGTASFQYTVADPAGGNATGTVSVTIDPVNDAPVLALTQSVAASSGAAKSVFVSASDPEGDPLTYSAGSAANGMVSGGSGGNFIYTSAGGFVGSDSFTVTVSDGKGGTSVQTVTVNVSPPTPDDWVMFASDGFAGEIGGSGTVFGSLGHQDITVIDTAGLVAFDPSFNRGGDVVRLAGDAADWTVVRSGSSAVFADGDTLVQVPVGSAGTAIVFDDGARTLRFDQPSNSFKIGDQAFASTQVGITADVDGTLLPGGVDPAATARVFMAEGSAVSAGGIVDIFGTLGAELVSARSGVVALDPSFNRGGDIVNFGSAAQDFTATRIGSSVLLEGADVDVLIPVGSTGATLAFAGGDDRVLRFDSAAMGFTIDGQLIGFDPVQLAAG